MRTPRILLPAALIATCAAILLSSACGIITAPVSVPQAVADNSFFNLEGPIVDASGQPVSGVAFSQVLHHRFWEPMEGSTTTDEHKLRRVDNNYTVNERGSYVELKFTHDGFSDADYIIWAGTPPYIQSDFGNWPAAKNFPIVLLSKDHPKGTTISDTYKIDYSSYPRAEVINLRTLGHPTRTVADAASFPPGTLYLTIDKQDATPINAHGDLDPVDVNLPAHITLHITGPDGGLLRIPVRIGYPPLQTSNIAPTTGYSPELVIDRKRLKEMRRASAKDIIEGFEYFYYSAAGHYGKASLRWEMSAGKDGKQILPLVFRLEVFTQPKAGATDLTINNECACPK